MVKLINESANEFTDISSEDYREYRFPAGETILIDKPAYLSVSKSGGHRLLNEAGISYYIPSGWLMLSWKVKDGQPHFVK